MKACAGVLRAQSNEAEPLSDKSLSGFKAAMEDLPERSRSTMARDSGRKTQKKVQKKIYREG